MNLLKNQSTFHYFTDFLSPQLQLRYLTKSIKSSPMMQLQNVEHPTFELVNEDATRRTCPVALDHSGDEYDGLAYAPDSLVINCVGIKDDQTEENTFEILQHSDININNS